LTRIQRVMDFQTNASITQELPPLQDGGEDVHHAESNHRRQQMIYDALIVASALEAGCTTLVSEDMQDGRVIDGRLTIRNPFDITPA